MAVHVCPKCNSTNVKFLHSVCTAKPWDISYEKPLHLLGDPAYYGDYYVCNECNHYFHFVINHGKTLQIVDDTEENNDVPKKEM